MWTTPSTEIYRSYATRPLPVPPWIERGYATGPLLGTEYRAGGDYTPNTFKDLRPPVWVKITAIGSDSVNGIPVASVAFVKPAWYESPWFLGALVAVITTEAINLGVSAYKRHRRQFKSRPSART